ncbi:MAG: hypothetical protein WBC92_19550 [Terracidiphilus sp.]
MPFLLIQLGACVVSRSLGRWLKGSYCSEGVRRGEAHLCDHATSYFAIQLKYEFGAVKKLISPFGAVQSGNSRDNVSEETGDGGNDLGPPG